MADPVEFLRSTALGTRMTVRSRLADDSSGARFTDAVGYLRTCTDLECVIETRHGTATVLLADVTAAKAIPPPPDPRPRRFPPPRD